MKRVHVQGVGFNAPGCVSWQHARALIHEVAPPAAATPTADRMNARDRRRASETVRLALSTGFEALEAAAIDPKSTPAIFSSCHGEGVTTHQLLAALADPKPMVSPTLFHNSVHNTPAGYWSIAAASRAPTTSIAGGNFSFAAGLLKALAWMTYYRRPVLLVAYDAPFPDPLSRSCPVSGPLCVALALAPASEAGAWGSLEVEIVEQSDKEAVRPRTKIWAPLFETNPIGKSLPLIEALSQPDAAIVHLALAGSRKLSVNVSARTSP